MNAGRARDRARPAGHRTGIALRVAGLADGGWKDPLVEVVVVLQQHLNAGRGIWPLRRARQHDAKLAQLG